jgi:hypothetical protein
MARVSLIRRYPGEITVAIQNNLSPFRQEITKLKGRTDNVGTPIIDLYHQI